MACVDDSIFRKRCELLIQSRMHLRGRPCRSGGQLMQEATRRGYIPSKKRPQPPMKRVSLQEAFSTSSPREAVRNVPRKDGFLASLPVGDEVTDRVLGMTRRRHYVGPRLAAQPPWTDRRSESGGRGSPHLMSRSLPIENVSPSPTCWVIPVQASLPPTTLTPGYLALKSALPPESVTSKNDD